MKTRFEKTYLAAVSAIALATVFSVSGCGSSEDDSAVQNTANPQGTGYFNGAPYGGGYPGGVQPGQHIRNNGLARDGSWHPFNPFILQPECEENSTQLSIQVVIGNQNFVLAPQEEVTVSQGGMITSVQAIGWSGCFVYLGNPLSIY